MYLPGQDIDQKQPQGYRLMPVQTRRQANVLVAHPQNRLIVSTSDVCLPLGTLLTNLWRHKTRPRLLNSVRAFVFNRIILMLARAGIRDMRFHDIRDACAALRLSSRQSPAYMRQ